MLHDEAMIVRLSISNWTARKFDKRVSREIAVEHQVSADVGRYNKVLIDKEAIREVTQAISAARTFHCENTLPWDDGGGRILPAKNFLVYSKEMRVLKQRFEEAVSRFVENYDKHRNDARRKLNGMFREEDYPGRWEIKAKFGFSTDIDPVPTSEDFRVSVGDKDMERIRKQLEDRVAERMGEATRDLFIRLNDVVGRLAEALSEDGKIFRNSKVENIIEVVNLLPRLNVANDPELEALCKETKKKLCALEPQTLRDSSAARSNAAEDAKALMDKMGGYFGKK
jgi:hypothetical protein